MIDTGATGFYQTIGKHNSGQMGLITSSERMYISIHIILHVDTNGFHQCTVNIGIMLES